MRVPTPLLEVAICVSPIVLFVGGAAWTQSARTHVAPSMAIAGLALVLCVAWAVTLLLGLGARAVPIALRLRGSFRATAPLYAVLLAHAVAKLAYVDLLPRWDAGYYFSALQDALARFDGTLSGFTTLFRLADHPTHAPALYWALGQFVAPQSHQILNLQNLLMASAGLVCFWLLLGRLFHGVSAVERGLLVAALAFNPLYFATSMTINADHPVAFFALLALAAFVRRRLVIFVFAGLGLCLSKEPGFLLYVLMLLSIGALFLLRRLKGRTLADLGAAFRRGVGDAGRPSAVRLAGVGAFTLLPIAAYRWIQSAVPESQWAQKAAAWNNYGFKVFGFNPLNFTRVLGEGTVLSFSWIATAFVLACLIRRVLRPAASNKLERDSAEVLWIVGLLFGAYLLVHCLYINYWNPRYVAPLAPLLLALFAFALGDLIRSARWRVATLVLFVALCTLQVWRTIDPVSRRLYGVFSVGGTELLDIATELQAKADGMVYNAQFANIETLYRQFNRRAFADGHRPLVLFGLDNSWVVYYNLYGLRIDRTTHDYTFHRADGFVPLCAPPDMLTAANAPPRVFYVGLPWLDDIEQSLTTLRRLYRVKDSYLLASGGFEAHVFELERL